MWSGYSHLFMNFPQFVEIHSQRQSMKQKQMFFWNSLIFFYDPSVQFSSVAQSCPTLCDPMNRSMPCLPVHHQLPEFTQTQCPSDVGNLISGFSAFPKSSLYILKFSVHILLTPSLNDFDIILLTCEMSTIVQQFEHYLALPFFGI